MSVTVEEFRAYVGTKEDSSFIDDCLESGIAMVARYIGEVTTVPVNIENQAVLVCASEIFHRRQAPGGVTQFADMSGSAVRVGKDPMNAAYELLRPFCGGFAV